METILSHVVALLDVSTALYCSLTVALIQPLCIFMDYFEFVQVISQLEVLLIVEEVAILALGAKHHSTDDLSSTNPPQCHPIKHTTIV